MGARGRLRVVAGSAGGLRLESLPGDAVRPTTERVREAVFSALGGSVTGVAVLDGFAGTGAMAVEALSRGAARAVLVERDRRAAAVCERNLTHAGFADRGRVVVDALEHVLHRAPPPEAPFGLVCLDPPYERSDPEVDAVLGALAAPGWLTGAARVVIERPAGSRSSPPPGWEPRFARTYGDTLVHLLIAGDSDSAS